MPQENPFDIDDVRWDDDDDNPFNIDHKEYCEDGYDILTLENINEYFNSQKILDIIYDGEKKYVGIIVDYDRSRELPYIPKTITVKEVNEGGDGIHKLNVTKCCFKFSDEYANPYRRGGKQKTKRKQYKKSKKNKKKTTRKNKCGKRFPKN